MPPCRSSLKQHIKRTNYQVAIWKAADKNYPNIPDCTLHGWKKEGESVEPVWTDVDILPKTLIDIINDPNDSESENDDAMDSSFTTSDDSDEEFLVNL